MMFLINEFTTNNKNKRSLAKNIKNNEISAVALQPSTDKKLNTKWIKYIQERCDKKKIMKNKSKNVLIKRLFFKKEYNIGLEWALSYCQHA